MTWEIVATLAAFVSVVLIARQNSLGWPFGIVWSVISAWLAFSEWKLISDAILYTTYIPIQIYCWCSWSRSKNVKSQITPTWLPSSSRWIWVVTVVGLILVWGLGIDFLSDYYAWIPAPAMLWRDASSTVLNYIAQFLQARKRMENWIGWVIVNLLGIHIYWVQGSVIYSFQYGFFLLLGIYGWWEWQRTIKKI